MKQKRPIILIISILTIFSCILCSCDEKTYSSTSETFFNVTQSNPVLDESDVSANDIKISFDSIPDFNGEPYIEINNNIPFFTDKDLTTSSFEFYSDLDSLGRCGVCYACIGQDIMPTEKRGPIGMVKPSGWKMAKYDFVDGKYLYNRCHLIGYQLTGENANINNLITGTRYLNVVGMLPFENVVSDYISSTNNHVMYRVTPMFEGDNLVASGVEMEGFSVEDSGAEICFNVYCYNVQPNVKINYANGDSEEINDTIEYITENSKENTYILNINTKKFHKLDCSSVNDIKSANKRKYSGDREILIEQGYTPCKTCNP